MDLGITVSSVELFDKYIHFQTLQEEDKEGGMLEDNDKEGGWDVGGQRQGGWDVGWVSCSHELLEARREGGGGGGMGGWPPLIHTCCHGPMCV